MARFMGRDDFEKARKRAPTDRYVRKSRELGFDVSLTAKDAAAWTSERAQRPSEEAFEVEAIS